MPYRVVDILEHWRAQGAISPDQFAAGRHFVRLYDSAIGGRAAIDPERIRVDGGLGQGAAAERILLARTELAQLGAVVGQIDFTLLCRILGLGRDLKADTPDPGERKYLARRVRDALGTIANHDRMQDGSGPHHS